MIFFLDEKIGKRLVVESLRSAINSLVQLKYEKELPEILLLMKAQYMLVNHLENPKQDFLDFTRMISGNPTIDFNLKVAQSEKSTRFRNIVLANFLKSFRNINNDVDEVLDFYFH